jgi:NDP-sugar pyrophosphorylase family protein
MVDVPLIRYSLAMLRGHGVRDVIVNLHHLATQIEEELGDEVAYSRESGAPLGTGGGIRKAAPFFAGERCVVVNGKIVADLDLDALSRHHQRAGAVATLVVRPRLPQEPFAAVDVDAETGRLKNLRGATGDYVFTGVHLIEPEVIARLPAGTSDIIGDAYLPLLTAGAPLSAFIMRGYFGEHSTPARYLSGNVSVLRGEARLLHPPGPLSGVDPAARVHASAVVTAPVRVGAGAIVEAGATIGPDVVVGRGGRVAASVRLERTVVWPGATASSTLQDAIVTPKQVLRVKP